MNECMDIMRKEMLKERRQKEWRQMNEGMCEGISQTDEDTLCSYINICLHVKWIFSQLHYFYLCVAWFYAPPPHHTSSCSFLLLTPWVCVFRCLPGGCLCLFVSFILLACCINRISFCSAVARSVGVGTNDVLITKFDPDSAIRYTCEHGSQSWLCWVIQNDVTSTSGCSQYSAHMVAVACVHGTQETHAHTHTHTHTHTYTRIASWGYTCPKPTILQSRRSVYMMCIECPCICCTYHSYYTYILYTVILYYTYYILFLLKYAPVCNFVNKRASYGHKWYTLLDCVYLRIYSIHMTESWTGCSTTKSEQEQTEF